MPTAGDLRDRVAFGSRSVQAADPVDGKDYGNTVTSDFAEAFTVWAQIKPLKGGEEVIGQRIQGVQPVLILVRYSSQTARIDTGWRARDVRSGVLYDVTAVADMDRTRAWMTLMATAGRAP